MPSLLRPALAFVTLSLMTCGALAQSAQKSGTGVITGRISQGDKAAQGVPVVLLTSNRGPRQETVARVTSDAEGNYRLTNVAAGRYSIAPIAPTMVGPSESSYGEIGRSIIIAEGETIEKIDFALARGGVITGRITDADGRPIVDERVALNPNTDSLNKMRSWLYQNPFMFQTDDRGVYRIYGIPPGLYTVSIGEASQEGMVRVGRDFYQRTFYPGETDAKKATVIEVKEGSEVSNVDIKLGRPAQSFAVTGRVIDADTGQPVPQIMVAQGAIMPGTNRLAHWDFGARTDARGQFTIQGLTPGRYAVFGWTEGETYSDPLPFEILDGDVSGLEVKMRRGATISGVAQIEGTSDPRVLARLEQLSIGIYVRSQELQRPANVQTTIGADGRFRLTGVPPGKAMIFMRTYPQPKDIKLARIERDGVLVQNDGIDVTPGAEITGVRIIFDYGTGILRGEVRVENGTLPEGSRIMVTVVRPGSDPNRPIGGAEVDTRGRFLIEGLAPGDYQLIMRVYNTQGPNRLRSVVKQSVSVTNGVETQTALVLDLAAKESEEK